MTTTMARTGYSAMLGAACEYAALGWPVLPIAARGKVPLTAHGLKDATTDAETIGQWWARSPDANVGIATGPPGPTVIDCDGPIGKRSWSSFVAGIGLESSPWCSTGGGGWHIYYLGDERVRNRASWLRKVDVRGAGGYAVAAPSIHESGAEYWWIEGPDERDLQPLPPAVCAALTARPAPIAERPFLVPKRGTGYANAALDGEIARVYSAPIGARNDTLNRAAHALGSLVAAGRLELATVTDALLAAATGVGLPPREAAATITSGLRGGLAKPRRR